MQVSWLTDSSSIRTSIWIYSVWYIRKLFQSAAELLGSILFVCLVWFVVVLVCLFFPLKSKQKTDLGDIILIEAISCMHPAWNTWLTTNGVLIKKSRGYGEGMESWMLGVMVSIYPCSRGPRKIK